MTPLDHLAALGTSVWIDGLVPPAELARLVRDGVTGLTSNPTIFRAAVLGSDRYARRIAALAGRSPLERYEALAIEDVQAAADALAPVFARSGGADGFVSLEVAPALADDADGTVAVARELWARVDRPNAMIKISAIAAGVEATSRATADGINVQRDAAVLRRAPRGGHRRLPDRARGAAAPRPADSARGVGGQLLRLARGHGGRSAAGRARARRPGRRAAVANARLAYARASELFAGPRFAALRAAGARPQRPLWASTGTKDARYSDVKYVDELAGPGVVNTMPPATLAAFRDHGAPHDRLTGSHARAQATLGQLAAAGVDLDAVTNRLLDDGVAGFATSMDELLTGLRTSPSDPERSAA
jgi:transaldolase